MSIIHVNAWIKWLMTLAKLKYMYLKNLTEKICTIAFTCMTLESSHSSGSRLYVRNTRTKLETQVWQCVHTFSK